MTFLTQVFAARVLDRLSRMDRTGNHNHLLVRSAIFLDARHARTGIRADANAGARRAQRVQFTAAAAARNIVPTYQEQFQPIRFDVGALNAATAEYFTSSDMGPFAASGSGQDSGAGTGGWNRR